MFTQAAATPITDKIWKISELNQATKDLLDAQFGTLWLEGEISNFSCPSSGHWYFTLKDSHASIRGAMFKFSNQKLGFKPKDGMQILVKAKVSLYAERGEFQIVAERMLPSGDGQLKLQFEELKAKLQKLGYFEPNQKQPIPTYPQTIGLITSPTGAAIQDMLKVLRRRYPVAQVWVYPTAVQGKDAAPQIVNALKLAQKHALCDVLIIARGGGSLEDLWPFNEEIVAHAIFQCKLPIVSGVGHETDFTICDFIADLRAPTPSAAAEQITPNGAELVAYLEKEHLLLQSGILKRIQNSYQTLDYLEKRLIHPKQRLHQAKEQLSTQTARLQQAITAYMKQQRYQLSTLCRALETLSPLNVLGRGFAIVKHQGHILKDTSYIKSKDLIEITLAEGKIVATVESI